ncbi:MAG: hypothetical protein WAT79_02045 [Saprospiraceae bacterium]
MSKEWSFELLSYLFIIGVVALFVLPIYNESDQLYGFYIENIVGIVVFFSFTKYIFLLKFTPVARAKWIKFASVFLCIPLLMYLVGSLYDFQRFLDEEGIASVLLHTGDMSNYNFGKFIKYQFIFFTTGAIVVTAFMPIRLIISFWRTRNTVDQV